MNSIISPLVSEKSMSEAGQNKYTFRVTIASDKNSIKREVEARFKVNVLKVSTITTKGRSMIAGTKRTRIFKEPSKKAIVKIKQGQKIALFEATGQTK